MFYNRILERIILPIGDTIFGGQYIKSIKLTEQILSQNRQFILNLQRKNLIEILTLARQKSVYYKRLPIEFQNDPFKQLSAFPLLTKDNIRSNYEELLTKKSGLIKNSTSGSTGIQTEIYIDKQEQSLIRAIQTIWWKWAGYQIGTPMLQTGLGTTRSFEKRLKDFFFQTYYQFAFGLTTENTYDGLNWAKKKKSFLGGYASSLFVLAEIAEGQKIKLKSAVSWGDKLFDHYKKKIETVFSCRVYETYGTGEGLMLGAQKDLDYLYIMDPYFIVEILDDNGNEVVDGEIGHVVVTSLIHKTMPLIRYKVGDLAIKLPSNLYPLKQDLALGLFQKIIGRETDIITTPSGRKLIVHSFTGVFEYFSEIKQFQVVQKKNDTAITINYIEGMNFRNKVLKDIHEKLNHLANEQLMITFNQVYEIKNSKSGKPQIVVIVD